MKFKVYDEAEETVSEIEMDPYWCNCVWFLGIFWDKGRQVVSLGEYVTLPKTPGYIPETGVKVTTRFTFKDQSAAVKFYTGFRDLLSQTRPS